MGDASFGSRGSHRVPRRGGNSSIAAARRRVNAVGAGLARRGSVFAGRAEGEIIGVFRCSGVQVFRCSGDQREVGMREGSYMEIEPGMKVIGPDGEGIGSVDQVVADEASGIFVGLAIRHSLLGEERLVRGEQVERLHEGAVHVTARWDEPEPYVPVEQRIANAQQGYA
jgi:sporulation protein YlmC with PRC-barrel domain